MFLRLSVEPALLVDWNPHCYVSFHVDKISTIGTVESIMVLSCTQFVVDIPWKYIRVKNTKDAAVICWREDDSLLDIPPLEGTIYPPEE